MITRDGGPHFDPVPGIRRWMERSGTALAEGSPAARKQLILLVFLVVVTSVLLPRLGMPTDSAGVQIGPTILGLPLIAAGGVAVGWIAIGGFAVGAIAIGGGSIGILSLGGVAIGLLVGWGGAALGTYASGGLAIGGYAYSGQGVALGRYVAQGRQSERLIGS